MPHRPPFLFLERVEKVAASEAWASFTVGEPSQWELVLVEGMAQTAAALRARPGQPPRPGFLVGLRRVELSGRPRAGERVRFRVRVLRDLPPLTLVEGEARDESGALLCRGELKFHQPEEPRA